MMGSFVPAHAKIQMTDVSAAQTLLFNLQHDYIPVGGRSR